jgi:hypothetical protein
MQNYKDYGAPKLRAIIIMSLIEIVVMMIPTLAVASSCWDRYHDMSARFHEKIAELRFYAGGQGSRTAHPGDACSRYAIVLQLATSLTEFYRYDKCALTDPKRDEHLAGWENGLYNTKLHAEGCGIR